MEIWMFVGFSEARDEKWSSTKPSQYRKGLQLCAVCMCVCDQRAAAISTSLFIIVFLFSFWFFLSIRSKNACMRANVGVCVVHSFDCLQFDSQTRTDNQSKPKTNRVRNYLRQQQTEKKNACNKKQWKHKVNNKRWRVHQKQIHVCFNQP